MYNKFIDAIISPFFMMSKRFHQFYEMKMITLDVWYLCQM